MATGLLGFNPYGGGTVLDISSKPSQFAIQHLQHEQAKDEALDNYFRDLDKTVNTAGIRDIDQQAVLQKLADNRDIYFKNRDALKHPEKYGVDLYNQYMNNYRAAQNIINKSKQEYANQKAAQNLMNEARAKGEVVSDDFAKSIANNQGKSVEDTSFVPTDLASFRTHIPHNDLAYSKLLKTVKLNQGNAATDYRTDRLPDNQTQVTYAKHYPDLEEIKSYSNDALNNQNPKISEGEKIFAQSLLNNPNEVKRLATIYKERTGSTMPITPEGIHLAHSISLAPIQEIKIKEGDTPEYTAAKLAAQENKQIQTYWRTTGAKTKQDIDNEVASNKNALTDKIDEANKNKRLIYNPNTGKNEYWGTVPLTGDQIKLFPQAETITTTKDGQPISYTKQKTPDEVLVDNEGNFYPYFKKLDPATGKEITHTLGKETIPAKDMARVLVTPTTTAKYRSLSIDAATKEHANRYNTQQPSTKIIPFIDGKNLYNIPENQINDFLKDHPKAKKR